jgi:hypothetical protein
VQGRSWGNERIATLWSGFSTGLTRLRRVCASLRQIHLQDGQDFNPSTLLRTIYNHGPYDFAQDKFNHGFHGLHGFCFATEENEVHRGWIGRELRSLLDSVRPILETNRCFCDRSCPHPTRLSSLRPILSCP